MATGLKSRIIYKKHTSDNVWTGTYKLLLRPKSIPSPMGERSMVDVSTLEDLMEVQEPGRRAAASVSVQGAMEKTYLDALNELQDVKLDIIHLYGTEGTGSIGKLAYVGTVDVTPDEASDDHLTMTSNIAVSTVPKFITDDVKVEVEEAADGSLTFNVSAKTVDDDYEVVTPEGSEDPKALGWYEKTGSAYALTEDETVDGGKTYYTKK